MEKYIETFNYRPDGDLNEVIEHAKALEVIKAVRYAYNAENYVKKHKGNMPRKEFIQSQGGKDWYDNYKPEDETTSYEYEYDELTWSKTYNHDNIKVILTSEIVSDFFNGECADDWYIGRIEYPKNPIKLLGKNQADEELSVALKANFIEYEIKEIKEFHNMRCNWAAEYKYVKENTIRYAYEIAHLINVDDIVFISLIYDGQPSIEEIKNQLNQTND